MGIVRNTFAVIVAIAAWQFYAHNFPKTKEAPKVSGYFHPSFTKVADTFKSNLASGKERGAAFAVYYKGEVLIDIWGGWADHETERHWQSDTMTLSWSMVKGVSAIVIARLVDMGLLDYKKEVYRYWPQFGAKNKKNITVEMLMSHQANFLYPCLQAGLIGLDEKITLHDYQKDWNYVEKLLAIQAPKWPAGTAVGYHGLTFGMYADALVRKVDPQHRNLSTFFQEEIAKPLDIEFYIGIPPEQYHRFARYKAASIWEQPFGYMELYLMTLNPYFKIAFEVLEMPDKGFNNPELLSVGFPSVMGIGTARSLAKLYDFIANGGSLKGKRLLSPGVVEALVQPLTQGLPNLLILSSPLSRGLIVDRKKEGQHVVGHHGYGGNMAFADPTIGVGVAYTTNYMGGYLLDDPREVSLRDAFYECFPAYRAQLPPHRGV
ncbi:unnamed protein product [Lymnaea stagnalis]|uniref:Beta-lactamase-related domain-containing protein n=1 Tax=Lymnaea stagnalis TaxID=6523 RepID=A0AAV2IEM6_LYMST